ncbi:GNAT family N-acetyltransferase [Rhizomonospora bruguierae]|uniref:GNAT family N-acetyltransferase n=1 Tax=Rhizomonospora bruguierae TaxID=1581705 RepID=UPI001BCA9E5F|nr:GNAT family N-acetyltransferase [Micromonospora sp. NBRC 107566]
MDVRIEKGRPGDAGELITVQRAAFVGEAQLYGTPFLPPLTERPEEVFAPGVAVLVARLGARLVGSVRGVLSGPTWLVKRLAVAPDLHGRGIGSRLLAAVEAAAPPAATQLQLDTGARSEPNLRLYRRYGYAEVDRRAISPDVTLVYLRKRIAG